MGGSAPKLTGVLVRVYTDAFLAKPIALSCPAQGSPVPAFRFERNLRRLCLPEPVGGSPPKFPDNSKISSVDSFSGRYSTLLCPAQGSPVPAFRSILTFRNTLCALLLDIEI